MLNVNYAEVMLNEINNSFGVFPIPVIMFKGCRLIIYRKFLVHDFTHQIGSDFFYNSKFVKMKGLINTPVNKVGPVGWDRTLAVKSRKKHLQICFCKKSAF